MQIDSIKEKIASANGLDKVIKQGTKLGAQREALMKQVKDIDLKSESLRNQREELESETGEYYERAIFLISDVINDAGIQELKAQARSIEGTKDDSLVNKLTKIDDLRERVSQEAREVSSFRVLGERGVQSLSKLQRAFTSNDYESRRSVFSPNFNIQSLVEGLLRGTVRENEAWSMISSNQQFVRSRQPG